MPMISKLVFSCPRCGKKMVNDAICGRCGNDFTDGELNVHDVRLAASDMGGVRPAAPSEVDYFGRMRQFPVTEDEAEAKRIAKAKDDFRASFDTNLARIVEKAVAAGLAKAGGKK